jgi:putative transposase
LIELQKRYFDNFDTYLSTSKDSPMWLKNEKIADIVKEALHYRDNKFYDLLCYCIMPNYVHLVFKPLINTNSIVGRPDWSTYGVTYILQKIKWNTALKANRVLNRSGAFWQHESYDHLVRNNDELPGIVDYILNNPVKAGFVDEWTEW